MVLNKPELKKKESDNNQIADVMKKIEQKKKSNFNNFNNFNNQPINIANNNVPHPQNQDKNVINSENRKIYPSPSNSKNSSGNRDEISNPLQELMKKGREQIKNKNPQDLVWMGKEKHKPQEISPNNIEVKKKEIKFPKVIIVEKANQHNLQSNNISHNTEISTEHNTEVNNSLEKNEIDINPNVILKDDPRNVFEEMRRKNKKEAEDFYNLNRYLNELAKLEDEEELDPGDDGKDFKEVHLEYKPEDINSRDFNEISEEIEKEIPDKNAFEADQNTSDNSQIEMLRIELEKSLGFDVFKRVYKTVDSQVRAS